jgi:hypothetical protein
LAAEKRGLQVSVFNINQHPPLQTDLIKCRTVEPTCRFIAGGTIKCIENDSWHPPACTDAKVINAEK